ncbi:MAG: hypothetical protein ACK4PM_14420 [Acinetobacter junii]
MSQFLHIAEKIYNDLNKNMIFTNDPLENLNNLILIIRQELKPTKLKLMYNLIDFEECLSKPNSECKVKIDISLIPKLKNKDEFLLWLASFIEHLTTDSTKKIPPIRKFIPPEFKYNTPKELNNNPPIIQEFSKNGDLINSYFKSEEFIKIIKNNNK